MTNIKKVRQFTINSLLAAGVLPVSVALADDIPKDVGEVSLDSIKSIVNDISDQQTYTLAQHQSHSSHGSHGSHGSHQSHAGPTTLAASPTNVKGETSTIRLADDPFYSNERNEQSTPRSSILPSSPAITKTQKLKRLPGNSEKFHDTIRRLQFALTGIGYSVGNFAGELDARTIAAIYEYQSDAGFLPSGKVTPQTLSGLNIVVQ